MGDGADHPKAPDPTTVIQDLHNTITQLNLTISQLNSRIEAQQSTIENLTKRLEENGLPNSVANLPPCSWPQLPNQTDIEFRSAPDRKRQRQNDSLDSDTSIANETDSSTPAFKPPPLVINSTKSREIMNALIQGLPDLKLTFTTLSDNSVKIHSETESAFRQVRDCLIKNKVEYFTHQLRSDKLFRVVVRGLHPQTETKTIAEDLQSQGHAAIRTTNVLIKKPTEPGSRTKTSKPSPLFFVDLKPQPNNQEIYAIKFINYQRVRIEPPNSKRDIIPQCLKCQQLGHTQNFCAQKERCVKCAGNHPTSKCPVPIDRKPKCANCSGEHTANYRGCPAYKAAYERRFPKQVKAVDRIRELKSVRENVTYANATKTHSSTNQAAAPSEVPRPSVQILPETALQLNTPLPDLSSSIEKIANSLTTLATNFDSFRTEVSARLTKLESFRQQTTSKPTVTPVKTLSQLATKKKPK